MAAHFTVSSDSESDPSEEVEEGEYSQSSTEQEQQLRQRQTLTLPDFRMAGKKSDTMIWQRSSVDRQQPKEKQAQHYTTQPLLMSVSIAENLN